MLQMQMSVIIVAMYMICVDRCNSKQFHCARGTTCIDAQQQCDGFTNCNDTSDEANCCTLYVVHHDELQYTYKIAII